MYEHQLTIGDRSGDGHDQQIYINFRSNKTKESILTSYKLAVELSGFDLEQVCCEYEDNTIAYEDFGKLQSIGIEIDTESWECNEVGFEPYIEDFISMFFTMIKSQSPDFVYDIYEPDDLGLSLGYGLLT